MSEFTRRKFIKNSAAISLGILHAPLFGANVFSNTTLNPVLAEVKNGSPQEMVQKAIEVLGGIAKFVKKGDVVVVKPNIGWARRPEQAANTNPEIIAEIVKICKAAGASNVKVFDYTCNEAKRCYQLSGIEQAAQKEGAEVRYIYQQKFKSVNISNGKALKSWEFYQDALDADVFINVPVIKHHSLAKVTMGLKNMMGIIGGNRGQIHNNFDIKLVDINTIIRPHLIILDGTRILMRNGPVGGNINDVAVKNTIVAGTDPVAVDSLGASVFGVESNSLGYLVEAHQRGLGEINLKQMKIERIDLAH